MQHQCGARPSGFSASARMTSVALTILQRHPFGFHIAASAITCRQLVGSEADYFLQSCRNVLDCPQCLMNSVRTPLGRRMFMWDIRQRDLPWFCQWYGVRSLPGNDALLSSSSRGGFAKLELETLFPYDERSSLCAIKVKWFHLHGTGSRSTPSKSDNSVGRTAILWRLLSDNDAMLTSYSGGGIVEL